ncbi:helix-turn-helix domain-containing protein [Thermoflexus sp.]|uniref:helix-turn-helix domain-containing protein n=1 Tax=Thermoflexus sp. TaxID=1969742 RepID=UPI0026247A00|nr:helix-turn-helix domain-containing protein [Thermoflexus sp.]MCX7689845.1 helix-turn-helix domain-containing protein [Thermoflexus sp.]MDW8185106.1 helix-turn-helix domain-containing protein [Anaerolineae bacterium]
MKPKEAARLLGVTARCLRKWAQSGKVVTVRTPGGHYRYPLESILKALQNGRIQDDSEHSAALYARALRYKQVQEQLNVLRQAALEIGYRVVYEEYDLQRGHQMGLGLQRLLLLARGNAFRTVLITSYSRLGWLGAVDPRFFHLVFALLGVHLIPLSPFEESVGPAELLDDFHLLHQILSEYLGAMGRQANRKILWALERIRKGYSLEEDWVV